MDDNKKLVIYTAVLKIVQDMTNRGGLGDEWEEIEYAVQEEITATWRDIIIHELEMHEARVVGDT